MVTADGVGQICIPVEEEETASGAMRHLARGKAPDCKDDTEEATLVEEKQSSATRRSGGLPPAVKRVLATQETPVSQRCRALLLVNGKQGWRLEQPFSSACAAALDPRL